MFQFISDGIKPFVKLKRDNLFVINSKDLSDSVFRHQSNSVSLRSQHFTVIVLNNTSFKKYEHFATRSQETRPDAKFTLEVRTFKIKGDKFHFFYS